MLSDLSFISSGLRRNDGSIVEGTTGSFNTTVNNQSFIRRPSINKILERAPSFRQEGDMGRYVAFNDPGQPGAGFSNYQDYLDAGNAPVTNLTGTLGSPPNNIANIPLARDPGSPGGVQLPNGTGTQMPMGGISLPDGMRIGGAMIPEQGLLGSGMVGGVPSPINIDSPNIQPQGIASLTEYFPTQPINNFQPQIPSGYYNNQPQIPSGYYNTPTNGIMSLFG